MNVKEISFTSIPQVQNTNAYRAEERTTYKKETSTKDQYVARKETIEKKQKTTKGIPTAQFETIKRISDEYETLMIREDARTLEEFLEDDGKITEDGRAVFVTPFEIPYRGVLYTKNKTIEYDEQGRPITIISNSGTEQKIIRYDYWSATVRKTEEKYEIVECEDDAIPKTITKDAIF